MLSVTLRQLEYAVAVARHESVTLAAGALHVSQPTLSVALAQLEGASGQAAVPAPSRWPDAAHEFPGASFWTGPNEFWPI